jgi:hypothetical protein
MTNEEFLEYYKNLLIIQYKSSPKAIATIQLLIEIISIFELLIEIENGYDVETSGGQPQDILGKYIGVNRVVYGASFERDYWGFQVYGVTTYPIIIKPFITYNDYIPDVQFRSYRATSQSLYSLTDEEFRTVQKLKIVQNYSNYSTLEIDNLLFEFFGNNILHFDRQNMSIAYIFDSTIERLVIIANSEMLIPKPMAVSLSVSFTIDINNIFYLNRYNMALPNWATGFTTYSASPVGGWTKYGSL